ncbi:MAG: hypothetical protein OEL91_09610, partial [Burkholderiaceae bacterium]|nr:hypothetical protein [Burkholderiaceae bacterium]
MLLASSCFVGAAVAHQSNVIRVGTATLPAVQQYCSILNSNESSGPVCDFTDSPILASQLAPDKLVMQSIAALGSVRQQISLVGG